MIHLKNAINATTFTSHLLHSLQLESIIERIPKRSETKLRRFGYGISRKSDQMLIVKRDVLSNLSEIWAPIKDLAA